MKATGCWVPLVVTVIGQLSCVVGAREPLVNEQEFGALCAMINFSQDLETQQLEESVKDSARHIGAIGLAVGLQSLSEAEDVENVQVGRQGEGGGGGGYWSFWEEAGTKLKGDKTRYIQWVEANFDILRKEKIKEAVENAHTCMKTNNNLWLELKMSPINKSLSDALSGSNKADVMIKQHLEAVEVCGGKGGQPSVWAGKSLIVDLLCICGGSPMPNDRQQACCEGCSTGANEDPWKPVEQSNTRWKHLAQRCKSIGTNEKLSSSSLSRATKVFLEVLKRSTAQKEGTKTFLGAASGEPQHGCTGHTQPGNGKCVQYPTEMVGNENPAVPWLLVLQQAATRIDKLREIEKKLKDILRNVESIKTSKLSQMPRSGISQLKDGTTCNKGRGQKGPSSGVECSECESQAECTHTGCNKREGNCIDIKRPPLASQADKISVPLWLFFLP
ncbi:variant surface glycoprotein (VSG)-related, putative [Trypanosoma equiperdum]|uniref:Variant surface glycoprotein (VSG)-related, putative n=2 Tax=Trypanozoon TaxID=39700 RepID=Q586J1_TRYB2|nr:variant surface glycoprotein (VSG)-related, putative [Trypanosoma brucei brucei TREU927]AAQ15663.1 variant surface glycoprotein (VSG)-related, putative [Trypanosoma brucei brucei TREU927]AAX79179.1 variant surface glycoprotein (VSG)-related, putative [Trypanosoma brucei]SCU66850.1 variant surface glycoprotein (VSG)-related, putative [Trypanosoma equiperdum]